jgi:hypothetical protein
LFRYRRLRLIMIAGFFQEVKEVLSGNKFQEKEEK